MGPSRQAAPPLVHTGGVSSFAAVPEAVELLRQRGYEVVRSAGPAERARVVAVVWGDSPFGLAEAEKFPRLRVLARFGSGTDAVAVEELGRRGIVVERTPGVSTETVAEFALAMIILALRRTGPHLHGLCAEPESWRPEERGLDLLGSPIVGILGCGRIGLQTARLLERLGARVAAWNRTWPPDPIRGKVPESLVRVLSPEELITRVDVLSIHLALDQETSGLVGADLFQAVDASDRSVAIVNTARGAVTDEEALLTALDRGTVTAAALDVWSREGPQSSTGVVLRLRRHPRVLPTPHIAAYTQEAMRRCAILCAQRIVGALELKAGEHRLR